jgi:hypothetical protein
MHWEMDDTGGFSLHTTGFTLVLEWHDRSAAQVAPIVLAEIEKKLNARGPAKKKASADAYSEDFEGFWRAFPPQRKDKKRKAWEAWKKQVGILAVRFQSRDAAIAYLQARCEEFAQSWKGRSEYANAPETWLNGGSYDADPAAWTQHGSNGKGKPRLELPDDED